MSLVTPRPIVLVVVASVVSLLLPERFVSGLARLTAVVCILALGLEVCAGFSYRPDLFMRFSFSYYFLDLSRSVFLYGLPLFLALATVAIEKRKLARTIQAADRTLES